MRPGWVVRRVGAALGSVALLASMSCSGGGGDEQVRVVAPSAVADAAEDVTSGRFEQTVESDGWMMQLSGRFSGDDMALTLSSGDVPPSAAGTSSSDRFETIVVDGNSYTTSSTDPGRWTMVPQAAVPTNGSQPWQQNPMRWILDVLAETVVDRPGVAADADGVPVTRHELTLTGDKALNLLVPGGAENPMLDAAQFDDAATAERFRRILEYRADHTVIDVVVDLDENGELRDADLTYRPDPGDYPDCYFLHMAVTGDVHMRIYDLGEPQDIQAPPADSVDGPPEGLSESQISSGEGASDDSEQSEMLQTSAGPRSRLDVRGAIATFSDRIGLELGEVVELSDAELVDAFDRLLASDPSIEDLLTTDGTESGGVMTDLELHDGSFEGAQLDGCPE